ncbi:hypothetical protein JTB14_032854 [Gonioctena quinquepunctata]|nr:hypothetical protein JTB14_032854 [Gonioctena quinquepunctata]
MDIDLFRDEEQFSTFDTHNFMDNYPEDSTSLDDLHNFSQNEMYEWNLDGEREINGDIALIPMCEMNVSRLNDSSPCKDDFQKIMSDWQQFISLDSGCEEFRIEEPIITPEENEDELIQQKSSPLHNILNLPDTDNFDLTTYINESDLKPEPAIPIRKPKAGVKKIDLKAQRYIVDDDEDEVDVETVSECGENSPVLEAVDLNSLLEQFEATQVPDLPINYMENDTNIFASPENNISLKPNDMAVQNSCCNGLNIKAQPKLFKVKEESIFTSIKEEPIDTGMDVISQSYFEDVKNETVKLGIVKVKTEPANNQKKSKNKHKITSQTIKKEKELQQDNTFMEQLNTRVLKDEETEQKTQIIKREHIERRQNSEKVSLSPLHSEKLPKHEFIPQTSVKTSTPKQPSTPQQSSIQTSIHKTPESTTSLTHPVEPAKNKQIIDSLPQELINRIKESRKRKTISVIPPIPAKKPRGPRVQEAGAQVAPRNKAIKKVGSAETVQLDHDYCSLASPYPKNPKKDSGFESAEEDDRTIIGKQPTVKNADGKLMVSLLKVNTIHTAESNKKKKLNLEEYKKRREGFLKSQDSSQNCSPMSSACSSPLPEDENTRRIKHQEKLMKMAMEVLNTPPKAEKKQEQQPLVITPPPPIKIPIDMEKKELVSIGVNTDFKVKRKNLDSLAPVEQLDEIKPLLKKVSDKINGSSLITSVIENIPKVIDSCDNQDGKSEAQVNKLEHGEDKTIVYLPKNRAATKTKSVECQTNISLIQQTKASRYRRRRTSSSSSCSSKSSSHKSRKSRTSSRYDRRRRSSDSSRNSSHSSSSSHSTASRSSSSSYSSRSSTRSRSRSSSPRYSRKERDRLREVEERRVIYVGRVTKGTSKEDLRKRFQRFGLITNISLHSRDHGYLDNYGFVTFANKLDAYEAIEHGNDDPWQPKYDLSFGGRRIFCQTTYSDLDNMRDESGYFTQRSSEDSFDALLRDVQEKLRKRKV